MRRRFVTQHTPALVPFLFVDLQDPRLEGAGHQDPQGHDGGRPAEIAEPEAKAAGGARGTNSAQLRSFWPVLEFLLIGRAGAHHIPLTLAVRKYDHADINACLPPV